MVVSMAVLTRTYQSFEFVASVVEESAGDVVESFATDIQWFSKTFMQTLLVCAVTVIAVATERCVKYFAKPFTTPVSSDLPRHDPEQLPAFADIERKRMPGLLGIGLAAELGALEVPRLNWVSQDLVAVHTANYEDAKKICTECGIPNMVGQAWTWQVASKPGERRYSVRMPCAVPTERLTSPLRHVIFCSCPCHKT